MRQSLEYIIHNLKGSLEGVEVGVHTGENAQFMLNRLNMKMLYLVDHWTVYYEAGLELNSSIYMLDVYKRFIDKSNVKLMRLSSVDASEVLKDKQFDFVYIDADHSYNEVKTDIFRWFDRVKVGGVLCGHDFNIKSVKDAVCSIVQDDLINKSEGDWWVVKTDGMVLKGEKIITK